jgi:3-oxoacyl-[acyl-carrier-protein] synthase-3
MSKSIGILGMGKAVPQKVFFNDDFVKAGLDTSDEWIKERTGILQRYIVEEETTASLSIKAAEEAIKNAGINRDTIDAVIVATTTPDYPVFPSVACLVQSGLGLREVAAFDISAACSGFLYATEVATQMLKGGNYRNILVVGADTLSRVCDWRDRSTVVLFGDGAGAAILGEVSKGLGVLSTKLGSRGKDYEMLIIPVGGTKTPITAENVDSPDRYLKMDGKGVYKFAVNIIVGIIEEALEQANLKKEDIALFVPHQANKRIIEYARNKLGLSVDRVYVNIDRYGNTSAASIPIALSEANDKGLLKTGDVVVTVGFGAGLTYGTSVIKWA